MGKEVQAGREHLVRKKRRKHTKWAVLAKFFRFIFWTYISSRRRQEPLAYTDFLRGRGVPASLEHSRKVLLKRGDRRGEHELPVLLDTLAGVSIVFQGLSCHAQLRLTRSFDYQKVDPKETVFSDGEEGETFFFIMTGAVGITNSRGLSTQLHAGDCFGKANLFRRLPRRMTVVTSEACEFLKIEREAYNQILQGELDITYDEHAGFLKSLEPFHGWPDYRLLKLSRFFELKTFKEEAVIMRCGDTVQNFFVVHDGRCRIVKPLKESQLLIDKEGDHLERRKSVDVALLQAGEAFGDTSFMVGPAGLRLVSVVAHTKAIILEIKYRNFLRLVDDETRRKILIRSQQRSLWLEARARDKTRNPEDKLLPIISPPGSAPGSTTASPRSTTSHTSHRPSLPALATLETDAIGSPQGQGAGRSRAEAVKHSEMIAEGEMEVSLEDLDTRSCLREAPSCRPLVFEQWQIDEMQRKKVAEELTTGFQQRIGMLRASTIDPELRRCRARTVSVSAFASDEAPSPTSTAPNSRMTSRCPTPSSGTRPSTSDANARKRASVLRLSDSYLINNMQPLLSQDAMRQSTDSDSPLLAGRRKVLPELVITDSEHPDSMLCNIVPVHSLASSPTRPPSSLGARSPSPSQPPTPIGALSSVRQVCAAYVEAESTSDPLYRRNLHVAARKGWGDTQPTSPSRRQQVLPDVPDWSGAASSVAESADDILAACEALVARRAPRADQTGKAGKRLGPGMRRDVTGTASAPSLLRGMGGGAEREVTGTVDAWEVRRGAPRQGRRGSAGPSPRVSDSDSDSQSGSSPSRKRRDDHEEEQGEEHVTSRDRSQIVHLRTGRCVRVGLSGIAIEGPALPLQKLKRLTSKVPVNVSTTAGGSRRNNQWNPVMATPALPKFGRFY